MWILSMTKFKEVGDKQISSPFTVNGPSFNHSSDYRCWILKSSDMNPTVQVRTEFRT